MNNETADIDGDENHDSYVQNVTVQSLTTVGAAIGALGAGFIVKYGRWNCLQLCNIIIIASCIVQIFYENFALFNVGRVMYGIGIGGFSVFCNQYVSEIAP